MKLTCPSCGAIASAEAWQNDATARELMAAIIKLPSPLLPHILSYLTLYRPAKSALSWKKALRITKDLASMVATGHVLEQGKVARPCSPQIWALAIEQMIERRDTLSLPLGNHNYLRKITYGIADQEDAKRETVRNQNERTGSHRRPVAVQVDDGLLPIERAMKEKEARLKEAGIEQQKNK